MAKWDLTVELFYGGAWHTVPAYVRDPVTITRGRADEQGGAVPSILTATLAGTDYNPQNPTSVLYGLAGRNTPMRARFDTVTTTTLTEDFEDDELAFTFTSSGDVDWARSNNTSHGGSWSYRVGGLTNQTANLDVLVPPGATQVSFWYLDSGGLETFSIKFDGAGTQNLTANGVWTQATFSLAAISKLTITTTDSAGGSAFGSIDDLTFTVPTNVRGVGEVASWKPDRSVGFTAGGTGDAWTSVEAGGLLRRLGQGKQPSLSAMRRTTESTNPLAYWPVEDGFTSTGAGSVVSGKPPLAIIGPVPGFKSVEDFEDPFDPANPLRFGTSSLADISTGAVMQAAGLSLASQTASAWTVTVAAGGMDPATRTEDIDLLSWTTRGGGTYVRWVLRYLQSATRVQVVGVNADGAETVLIEKIGINLDFGPRYVSARQVSGNIQVDLYETAGDIPDETTTFAGALSGITSLTVNSTATTSTAPMPVGHVAVWSVVAPPAALVSAVDSYGKLVYGPWLSWYNEAATDRLARLAAEAGITMTMPSVAEQDVRRMGWQPTATLADLLQQAADVDGGLLYEPRNALTLAYRPLANLYNQDAVLTLDWASKQVAPPITSVLDDQHTRNDITAKRTDGSSARAVQASGPLNVSDPADDPEGVGRYATEVELNAALDAGLSDLAGWHLHLGTIDEPRFPQVTVDLDANPGLADDVSAVDIGDRIDVVNLPLDLSPFDLSLIVVGSVETVGSHRRTITFNCIPASAYRVFTVGNANLGRATTDGTERQGTPIASAASSATFVITAGPFWTTTAGDFPMTCVMGGEVVTVTAIGAPSGNTQLFTLTRSVNGVVKSHPVGTKIQVFEPGVIAL